MEKTPQNTDASIYLCSDHQTLIEDTEDDHIYFLHTLLSKDECRKLIQFSETIGYGSTSYNERYRGNLRLQTNDNYLAQELWKRIYKSAPKIPGWKAVGLNTRFRWSKYLPGTYFDKHVDTYYEENEKKRSYFTVNIYLNDNFLGGKTRFFKNRNPNLLPTMEVKPFPGKALVFAQPDLEYYTHDGEIVSDGIKYLLRSDIMYIKT